MWSDGEQSTYHAVWLRHNCQCPECWDSIANQKLVVDVNELRSDLKIHSVTGSGELYLLTLCLHTKYAKVIPVNTFPYTTIQIPIVSRASPSHEKFEARGCLARLTDT